MNIQNADDYVSIALYRQSLEGVTGLVHQLLFQRPKAHTFKRYLGLQPLYREFLTH